MNKLTILSEIYIILNTAVEKHITIDFPEFQLMIYKIIDNDSTFVEHCPIEIQPEIQFLKSILDEYPDKKLLLLEARNFINTFADVYAYEQCKVETGSLEKDRLYYKAVINSYYIIDLFTTNTESRFDNFKSEFFQIGILIGKYYKDADNSKIVKDIICSKLEDLFNRYDFRYSMPTCCSL